MIRLTSEWLCKTIHLAQLYYAPNAGNKERPGTFVPTVHCEKRDIDLMTLIYLRWYGRRSGRN